MLFEHEAVVLFLALFALYSPVAALSSYLPIVRPFGPAEQLRLALGLVVNVAVFVLLAIWVGEPLLKLLGISTAALTATGGIALLYASIPLMRGVGEPAAATEDGVGAEAPEPAAEPASPRSVLFTPSPSPSPSAGPPSHSGWRPRPMWAASTAACCCRSPPWPTPPSPA